MTHKLELSNEEFDSWEAARDALNSEWQAREARRQYTDQGTFKIEEIRQ